MAAIQSFSVWFIPILIGFILLYGTMKKIPTYETFVEGGKEGFSMAVSVIPYLVGMLVAISVFRASGALDLILGVFRPLFSMLHVPAEIVPLGLLRTISGTGALGMTSDLMATYGPD
jgi:spore maturation protein B